MSGEGANTPEQAVASDTPEHAIASDTPEQAVASDTPEQAVASDTPEEQALLEIGDEDAVFEALWKRALEAWDDERPHAAILDHALRTGKLPELAGRYRGLGDDADKNARAQKKIDAIVLAATQMLMATKTPPRTKTPWQWTAAAAATFALVCAYLFYQLFVPHR